MVRVMGIDEMNKVFKGYNNDEDLCRFVVVVYIFCCECGGDFCYPFQRGWQRHQKPTK